MEDDGKTLDGEFKVNDASTRPELQNNCNVDEKDNNAVEDTSGSVVVTPGGDDVDENVYKEADEIEERDRCSCSEDDYFKMEWKKDLS